MKFDKYYFRELLLELENQDEFSIVYSKYEPKKAYHLYLLSDGGFIECLKKEFQSSEYIICFQKLKTKGIEHLSLIRDKIKWDKTVLKIDNKHEGLDYIPWDLLIELLKKENKIC